jgi:hypothetical protein
MLDVERGIVDLPEGIFDLDRAKHRPCAGALDVVGITPDVPVPDYLADPLAFAVRLLAEEK